MGEPMSIAEPSDRELFRLEKGAGPAQLRLAVVEEICVGSPDHRFLFGGVGLGASIKALETVTGRPLLWATAQYLSFAQPPSMLELNVRAPKAGRRLTQARLVGEVEGREIFTVNAALGEGGVAIDHSWAKPFAAPPPEECPVLERPGAGRVGVHDLLETRLVQGCYGQARIEGRPRSESGRSVLWVRRADRGALTPGALAILADLLPGAVGSALGHATYVNSLDNTIRLCAPAEGEWALLDIQIDCVAAGIAHGRMNLFAENGALLATASQTGVLRDVGLRGG